MDASGVSVPPLEYLWDVFDCRSNPFQLAATLEKLDERIGVFQTNSQFHRESTVRVDVRAEQLDGDIRFRCSQRCEARAWRKAGVGDDAVSDLGRLDRSRGVGENLDGVVIALHEEEHERVQLLVGSVPPPAEAREAYREVRRLPFLAHFLLDDALEESSDADPFQNGSGILGFYVLNMSENVSEDEVLAAAQAEGEEAEFAVLFAHANNGSGRAEGTKVEGGGRHVNLLESRRRMTARNKANMSFGVTQQNRL